MSLWELLLLAIGLSMDAFAVSICKGLAVPKAKMRHMLICGLWFGGFQALMPTIGYLLGASFGGAISAVDHWIAFALLALIGGNMIREALSGEQEATDDSFGAKAMLVLAVATSIDALAVGVTFGLLPNVNILAAVSLIGATTFVCSAVGVKIGNVFGSRYESKAELLGGAILILIGIKVLLEHLGLIG
ncbi:MAG: manganese efflux pump MntP family protein [Clostridia bacterium]|nr:manganese efflux pump MntP family protein [Clostridia bacterium]